MLILMRKRNQAIRIGDDITVRVLDLNGGQVRIGIDAPREMKVLREELIERDRQDADNAASEG